MGQATRDRGGPAAWRGLLADIRRSDRARGRQRLGRFSIEGTRLHERALRAGAPLEAVLVSESFRDDPSPRVRRLLEQIEAGPCRCEVAPDSVLLELTAGRGTGSIVGLVRRAQLPSLAEILAGIEGGPRVVVVAVDIEDPGNVGALVRTALASGAAAFLEVGASDAHHPRAVRTSMGSVFKLPILGFATVRELLGEVDRAGLRKIGALSRGGDPPHTLAPGGGGVALFLGAEAFGLPPEVVAAMDAAVSVPMASGVDSLSVNAAAAVILYEITGRAGGVPAS